MDMPTIPINDFYVYALFREDARPLYIGKGRNHRWRQHMHTRELRRNTHKSNAIRSVFSALGEVPMIKLAEHLSEPDAFSLERLFIAAIGRHPNGPLVNQTDGGDGTTGMKHSAAFRELMASTHRGRKQSPEWIAKRIYGPNRKPPERKKKHHLTAQQIEQARRMGLANHGRKASDYAKEKMSAARRGGTWSAKRRETYNRYRYSEQFTLHLE